MMTSKVCCWRFVVMIILNSKRMLIFVLMPMMHRRRHGLRRICEKHLAAIIAENVVGSNIVALIVIIDDDLPR